MDDSPDQDASAVKPEQVKSETLAEDSEHDPIRPESVEIGECLDDLPTNDTLVQIAKTNEVQSTWPELKEIIKDTILKQCDRMETKTESSAFTATTDTIKTSIIHSIDQHDGPPFTIQRLCELVITPKPHYKMFIKYLHAIEKVLLVSSTWDRFPEVTVETNGLQDVSMADLEPIGFVSSRTHDEALDDLERVIKNNVAPIDEAVRAEEQDTESQDAAADKGSPTQEDEIDNDADKQPSKPTFPNPKASDTPEEPENSEDADASEEKETPKDNTAMDVDE